MNVLLVFAHPEPRSLNGALRDVAIQELEAQGHEVRVSDLYADRWKSEVDRADFPALAPDARFKPAAASGQAFAGNALTEDVRAEHAKLLWADALILQFPLWWFTMPAILKGWVDRVYAYGFAYGVGEHNDRRWGDRYGEGTLVGKRAMLLVTAGGWRSIMPPAGSTGRSTTCCSRSIMGSSIIRASTSCRRSWSTELIVSMRPVSRPLRSGCARGCGRSRPPRPSPIGSRMAATI